MGWDFETDAEYQELLDWADDFVRDEVEPLDLVLHDPYDKTDQAAMRIVRPLQAQVREKGLWACHLGPELGGQGYGQLKLALLNEILGRSKWAPSVFGCQAPDSGNAEILAHYGTPEQRAKYLQPLLDGTICSSYAMTEPTGGADPTLFTSRAVRDGNDWVINGEKWFASNARQASFFITIVVTRPDAERSHKRMSMFIVPADTPGIEIIRDVAVGARPTGSGSHGYIRFKDVRVPADHLLGQDGRAFEISQVRLGGGRVHHAMRTVGQVRRVFDMLCERAISRKVRDGTLSTFQMTQDKIADSWIEMEQFRLMVLQTAWKIDKYKDYKRVRKDIAAVKVLMPKVYHDAVQRAMHLHGSLGVSNEMPLASLLMMAMTMGIADGPTEVHKLTLARQVIKDYKPVTTPWPSAHLPTRRQAAQAKFADLLELDIANT